MYCGHCGAKAQEGQNYCNVCGGPLPVATAPSAGPAPVSSPAFPNYGTTQGRVAGHVRLLGILWIVMSILHMLPGVGLLGFRHFFMPFVPIGARGLVVPIVAVVGFALLASAIAGLLAGWGLLDRQPWARILALVLGFINLIHPPFGTALGIYTIWVLLPPDSETEWNRLARAA